MSGMLEVDAAGLAVPVRRGRVVVTSDAGVVLFTGYLATEPERVYAGAGTKGAMYRVALNAVSDEWLLDRESLGVSGMALSQSAGQMIRTLTSRMGGAALTVSGVAGAQQVGVFVPQQAAGFSANAGAVANAGYNAYRVVNGALSLETAGTTTHMFDDGDGTLSPAALKAAAVKELANDVTLSGEIEPAAYISETFAGDGSTTVFKLAEEPFRPKGSATLLTDSFNQGAFNTRVWQIADPGSHLSLGAGGLVMNGGNGFDGQTTLAAIDPVELGGTVVIEAGGVKLGGASVGVLCGLYSGVIANANCVAGFNVRQSGGNTMIAPMVNGTEVGTMYTMLSGHAYTMRLRLHSVESVRVKQTFYTMVDGALQSFGGGAVNAPVSLVFEIVDQGAASNTPATVLYDTASSGAVLSTPGSCSFVAVNSVQLFGSVAWCSVKQTGSAWVVSTLPSGVKQTRLIGVAGEGVDCMLSGTSTVTFFNGRTPVAGEFVTVMYRNRRRSVARLADATSVAAEQTSQWMGRVMHPAARTSVDCEAAAQAVLSFATSRSAALAGNYHAVNPATDVWPGDVLAITSGGETLSVMVRSVTVTDELCAPEVLSYAIDFANDWAESLGMKLSSTVAADALLPATAATGASTALVNLPSLQIVSATGTALQIDAGMAPPTGGGFEVRRADWNFGAAVGQDLVLRSPVRSFSIPREAQVERYYVRMYDGSGMYSRFSSAVYVNLPVG
jgi:hypothetical protein